MTRADLLARAVVTFAFRPRRVGESEAAYEVALIAHVDERDFAAAHELRVGTPQAAWSAAEVDAFVAHMTARIPAAPRELAPDATFRGVLDPGPYPATDLQLHRLAEKGLAAFVRFRRAAPEQELPIFATVLLTDGRLMTTSVGRGDRIAVVRALARSQPVFGFFVIADMFVHQIDAAQKTATKREGLIAQVGSRTMRIMKVRLYRVVDGVARFDDPAPADTDLRAVLAEGSTAVDPYAEIFVSVPPSEQRH